MGEAEGRKPVGEGAVVFVCAAMLIDTISFGILIPVLPSLLIELEGAAMTDATRTAGYLTVLFSALVFLFGPAMGNLSDRFGRRPILLGSVAAFCLNYVAMGFAQELWVLFVGRALTGVAGALYAPCNAYVADITPPERRAQRFALIGAAFGVGFILGPALSGLVGQFDPRAPFFVAAAMAGLNFLFGWFVLPESLPKERRRPYDIRRANPVGALSGLAGRRDVFPIVACMFLWMFAFQVYPATWAFFATLKFEMSPGAIGLQLAYSGLLMAMMQGGLTGRIVRRVGERSAALLGMASGAAGMIASAFAAAPWMLYVASTIGCLHGLAGASMNAIVTSRTPATEQGALQGGVSSLNGLGAVAAPLLLTQTLAAFSAPDAPLRFTGAAFVLSALIALAAMGLFFAATRGWRAIESAA
jgi:DHA1 family tetracycline resistance protein-like MFS transporter